MRDSDSATSKFVAWTAPLRAVSTSTLALVGFTVFLSGLFVLAAAGTRYPLLTYVFVLGAAALLRLPLLAVTGLVAASETLVGRAWANGLRRLTWGERTSRGTATRALRYGAVLWLANGAAFWVATLLSQLEP